MTRALVVHHDMDLGGQEADSLRRFGYEVTECSGPTEMSVRSSPVGHVTSLRVQTSSSTTSGPAATQKVPAH